ncbi:Pentatricopeptide repeat-containing protein [Rhynchospora pubera]|uniref:Pentatricopeptide repeat-containing protein n=1 Tax=Rhynchospora pubera TaxID=906938 RepID=A0AAV8BWM7_9POAL|nr:Pentatricopeptide repeat-containing protein [Rhynchospora pubera]
MAFLLTSVSRRSRSLHHHLRHLFSTSSTTTSDAHTPPSVSTVADSVFCSEPHPHRAISTLFSFPDPSCARYAADLALRRLSHSMNFTVRSQLLDSFLPLASSEKDFAALLVSYGSAFLPGRALAAFRQRLADGDPSSVSVISFNALLSTFMRSRRHREVPDLFVRLCKEHSIKPDVVSCGLLIKALFISNRSNDAFTVLKHIRDERGILLTYQIYKLLLVSLRSREKFKEVNQLWDEMLAAGYNKPDCTAYNVKVWCHAFRGELEKVYEVISEMEAAAFNRAQPDTVTYNYLIGCLSKKDRVEDVKEVYKTMKSKKGRCSPDAATFRNVLSFLCRHGDFEAGLEVFRDSLSNKNVVTEVRNLVRGLVQEGKMDAAKEVVKEVTNVQPSRTSLWKEVEESNAGF